MNHVICPNCRVVTPPWSYCAYCDAPLHSILDCIVEQPITSMDPQLFRLIERVQRQGIFKLATGSTNANEAAVIARVTDVDAFDALDQVRIKAIIKPTDDDRTFIITARMPIDIVEEARQQTFVKSLKASQRLRQCLEKTIEQTCVVTDLTTLKSLANGGSGVIVGIVDFGMDFMHRNFRNADGTSRILALWDQKASTEPPNSKSPGRYGYGREYKKDEIDAAIEEANRARDPERAYEKLGYAPPKDTILQTGAHGTYVADVATGNGLGTNAPGLAPQAGIVFVDVSTFPGPQGLGVTFGDSAQL
ncbi:MAG: S8 family serine peptidase, partial [Blastocatellia bacterium]